MGKVDLWGDGRVILPDGEIHLVPCAGRIVEYVFSRNERGSIL